MKLLSDYQKKVSWGRPDAELEEVKAGILTVPGYSLAELETMIRESCERGLTFKRQWERLDVALRRDLFAPELSAALKDRDILKEVHNKLVKKLQEKAENILDTLYGKGDAKAFLVFLDRVAAAYPCLKDSLEARRGEAEQLENVSRAAPAADRAKEQEAPEPEKREHRINCLSPREGVAPRQGWTLWIDESGENFESAVPGETGRRGRMVALLVPADTALQPLGAKFHAAALKGENTDPLLNSLLAEECGVFGLSVDSVDGSSREGWYALLHKVVRWVLRLLPCPEEQGKTVALDISIEERSDFGANLNPFLLKKEFSLLLGREKGDRSSRIVLRNVKFAGKNSGLLGWVDLLANYWGSTSSAKRKLLKLHGLLGTCLFSGEADLLEACETAMQGGLVSGQQWRLLMERPDAADKGSPVFLALEELKKTCVARPEAWENYVKATSSYLSEKKYDLDVLARQVTWLRGADNVPLPPDVRFFAKLTELAQFNHEGIIVSPELDAAKAVVEMLADRMALVYPQADLHAALRLAVCDANAFDFEKASARLDPWNPARSGKELRGEMAGKVFSSLGQYEAFQERFESASICFELALKEFAGLAVVDPALSRRQTAQTAAYAAVNAMDAPGCTREKAAVATSRALGLPIMEAMFDSGVSADRFRQYLLLRYLVFWGSEEERNACLRASDTWLDRDRGRRGHPWPLIWYYRSLLVKDVDLRSKLEKQLLRCRGESGITVDFICLVLEVSLGLTDPRSPEAAVVLDEVERLMPAATSRVEKVRTSSPGQADLVRRVLSFNYR